MKNTSKFSTKAIIEAGLISALIIILTLINAYVPGFSIFGTFLLPIPVTVLYIRHDFKIAISSVVVSGILVSLLYNPLTGITACIIFSLTGLTLGYCIKNNKKVSLTFLLLSVASALGTILNYTIYLSFIDKMSFRTFIDSTVKTINVSMNEAMAMYSKMGIPQQQLDQIKKSLEMINTEFIMMAIPAILCIGAIISAFICYKITRMILGKLRIHIKDVPPVTELYLNSRIATVIVCIVVIGLIMSKQNIKLGQYLQVSASIILQMVLLLDGVSLAGYFLRRRFNMSKPITVIIILFTAFAQPFSMMYIFAGLADIVVDFRKLDTMRKKLIKE